MLARSAGYSHIGYTLTLKTEDSMPCFSWCAVKFHLRESYFKSLRLIEDPKEEDVLVFFQKLFERSNAEKNSINDYRFTNALGATADPLPVPGRGGAHVSQNEEEE